MSEALRKQGFNPHPFLKQAGIADNVHETPEAWVPLTQFLEFVSSAVAGTGYTALGLDAGIAPRKRHSKFTKLVLYAPTLYQTLNSLCKNSALEDTSANFRVVRGATLGWLDCGQIKGSAEGVRQMELYRYAALVEVIRSAAGPAWLPTQLCLASGELSDCSVHPLFDGPEVRYGEAGLKIALEPKLFSLPMVHVPEVPLTDASYSESPIDFAESLTEVVRTQILSGDPALRATARALQMSTRTLQRRLYSQDMSYAALVSYVRIEMAKQWLQETNYAVSKIATRLAYRHSTHFSRAFTQACGLTPREYRRHHNPTKKAPH
jgi:AraC-like DNA-binding protein